MSKPSKPKEDPELKRLAAEAKKKAAAEKAAQEALARSEEAARQRGLRGLRALSGSGSSTGFLGASNGISLLS